MKKRWLLNFGLLALVAGLITFLYLRPKAELSEHAKYEISQLKLADISAIKVEFPAKAQVTFEKTDGLWRMTAPYQTRADQFLVQRILSIVAATTENKYPAEDLEKYGLDKPQLKVTLSGEGLNETFAYGTHNTVTGQQYMAYKDSVYLLSPGYSEAASVQSIEMIDKNLLSPTETKQVAGFDFSGLEQWEKVRLNVDITDGKWKTNISEAKITQNEMNEWLQFYWQQNPALSVKLYTPDRKVTYPSVEVKIKGGKNIRFDKIQESPKLLLARPDEGLIYLFSSDVGFTMLNPPLNAM